MGLDWSFHCVSPPTILHSQCIQHRGVNGYFARLDPCRFMEIHVDTQYRLTWWGKLESNGVTIHSIHSIHTLHTNFSSGLLTGRAPFGFCLGLQPIGLMDRPFDYNNHYILLFIFYPGIVFHKYACIGSIIAYITHTPSITPSGNPVTPSNSISGHSFVRQRFFLYSVLLLFSTSTSTSSPSTHSIGWIAFSSNLE